MVEKEQVLARLKNSDLELELSRIHGQIKQKRKEVAANNRLMTNTRGEEISKLEIYEIRQRIDEAGAAIESLIEEEKIFLEQQALLDVKSPIAGRIVNWNVKQNLMNRAVERGQKLMTVVAPDTSWQVELEMPEKRISHLLKAQRDSDTPLKVTFGLMSNPGTEYVGELVEIDTKLDVYSDEGNSALVVVAFSNQEIDIDLLRSETCLLYTSPSPRDATLSRMPSSA